MRVFVCALALAAMSRVAHADDRAPTEQEIEGVQNALKAIGCTVADREIEAEKNGYEAEDAICDRVQYDIYLDKDFNITNKVKED